MNKNFYLKVIIFLLIPYCFSCEKVSDNDNEIDFCALINSPKEYQSKIIQTKGVFLGYHTFIFYSDKCLEQEKVIALGMSYKDRQKIGEAKLNNNKTYQKDFLNNNLYAEITVLGELKENDESEQSEVFHPKYKFFVKEIIEVDILSEEVYPNEKARGLEKINIK